MWDHTPARTQDASGSRVIIGNERRKAAHLFNCHNEPHTFVILVQSLLRSHRTANTYAALWPKHHETKGPTAAKCCTFYKELIRSATVNLSPGMTTWQPHRAETPGAKAPEKQKGPTVIQRIWPFCCYSCGKHHITLRCAHCNEQQQRGMKGQAGSWGANREFAWFVFPFNHPAAPSCAAFQSNQGDKRRFSKINAHSVPVPFICPTTNIKNTGWFKTNQICIIIRLQLSISHSWI